LAKKEPRCEPGFFVGSFGAGFSTLSGWLFAVALPQHGKFDPLQFVLNGIPQDARQYGRRRDASEMISRHRVTA
jgi:hypothetical protein